MKKTGVRVRFAPSPTGFMHLGNVRAALINFLFARQHEGTFILRIEDTDQQRNLDPEGKHIQQDLAWLTIAYDEGPHKGGPYAPYYQSERTGIYKRFLELFLEKELIYRCFCTPEELEKKRLRQLALKQPPRYDRACLKLTSEEIEERLAAGTPFIWRFKLDHEKAVTFYDLAHKQMHFELKHFSDVPLTRQDGSFTFLFANFVDDYEMKITHVFRGEDHLTNTAAQVAMYEAFHAEVPVFWHLPIIGNAQGKKLSKRDFGFSLTDLRNGGYLPEAIANYLALIGHTVKEEIMDQAALIMNYDFDHISSTGQIRYDLEKLRWVNHHWIMKLDVSVIAERCRPYLIAADTAFEQLSHEQLIALIKPVQQEVVTLVDIVDLLTFVIKRPEITTQLSQEHKLQEYKPFLQEALAGLQTETPATVVARVQPLCKERGIPVKDVFALLRIAITGKPQGPSVKDLVSMLPADEAQARLSSLIS
jgi:nondiscriminating glutamyl-tRNA synthetase